MIKLTKHYNADIDEVDDEDDRAVKDRGRVEIAPSPGLYDYSCSYGYPYYNRYNCYMPEY